MFDSFLLLSYQGWPVAQDLRGEGGGLWVSECCFPRGWASCLSLPRRSYVSCYVLCTRMSLPPYVHLFFNLRLNWLWLLGLSNSGASGNPMHSFDQVVRGHKLSCLGWIEQAAWIWNGSLQQAGESTSLPKEGHSQLQTMVVMWSHDRTFWFFWENPEIQIFKNVISWF